MDSKRTLAAHAARITALSMIAVVAACDDTTTPPYPGQPPQITTTQTYAKGAKGLPNSDVYAMLAVSNGEFWIGTEQGIARYPSITATQHGGQGDIVNELNGLPHPKVRDMIELGGKVYVATWGGGFAIYDIAADAWTSRGVANGMRNGSIFDMDASATENKVYMATNDGVSIYDTLADNFTHFTALLRPVVSTVAVRDINGVVERWYGPRVESVEDDPPPPMPAAGITVSRGASTVFNYSKVNSGLPEPNVTAIYHDAGAGDDDVFWVATATKGVCRVDVSESVWTNYTTVQGLPSNTVYAVVRANGTIWVATQDGVARQKSDGTWQGYNTAGGLTSDRVRRVYSDDGERLWIGYINGGAARLNPESAE